MNGLFTDLYELTMCQAYVEEGMLDEAIFSLFVRRLPDRRNFLLACGLETTLEGLERLQFSGEDVEYLGTLDLFSDRFLQWLSGFRFSGSIRAVPEGTPVFADEPILEITGSLPETQLVETWIMNQIHLQTVLASKAYRVVAAAGKRAVVDFGARRMHGTDAAVAGARAYHIAGMTATSNVLAGKRYGIPVSGTMAHSYIQAHDSESAAFRAFANRYPTTVLLVDTYDTLSGVEEVTALARALGSQFRVSAVRLDSGDLARLAKESRKILDHAGLEQVEIFASGGLDEDKIAELLSSGAPIDGFGVGTAMGVSRDAPSLDIVYKLCQYAGHGRLKLSPGKPILPGPKQVFRVSDDGRDVEDVIGAADEDLRGRPLLETVMRDGRRLPEMVDDVASARQNATEQIARLPDSVRSLEKARPPYPVKVSARLASLQRELEEEVEEAGST